MLIDVTRLADRALQGRFPTGVDRVSLAYLQHFRERADALVRFGGRWVELNKADSRRIFDALLEGGPLANSTIRQCVGRGYVLSWKRRRGGLLFNTGHSGLDHVDYVNEICARQLQSVFFLHDLIPVSHPEYCRPGEADKHHRRLDAMLAVGSGLIVNSAATRDELLAYAAARSMNMPPCAVAPLAPARLPLPSRSRPLAKPYFVVLSTIEPRKNHLLLLHLWRQLIESLGEAAPRLVVIGQRGWECEQVVDLLDRCQALKGFVIELPRCSDVELANWLHHAQALLFPSFIEGFGIPLVEALMMGVPAIVSDLPVFHEIAGDIPEYLDPLDGLGWRRAVLSYIEPVGAKRCGQLARMVGFHAPTWDAHFAVVEELLARIDGTD